MATDLNEQLAAESERTMPTRELARKLCPNVPARDGITDHGSLASNQKAQRMLDFAPGNR
jgi:hypothetical protein